MYNGSLINSLLTPECSVVDCLVQRCGAILSLECEREAHESNASLLQELVDRVSTVLTLKH